MITLKDLNPELYEKLEPYDSLIFQHGGFIEFEIPIDIERDHTLQVCAFTDSDSHFLLGNREDDRLRDDNDDRWNSDNFYENNPESPSVMALFNKKSDLICIDVYAYDDGEPHIVWEKYYSLNGNRLVPHHQDEDEEK